MLGPVIRFFPMLRPPAAAGFAALAGGVCLAVVGCEPAEEPDFAPGPAYAALMAEARTGARAEVEDFETGERVEKDLPGLDAALRARFGTPGMPAVYTKLPVDFGPGEAVAADVIPGDPADDGAFAAEVTLEGPDGADPPPVAAGDVIHWTDFDGNPHAAAPAAADGATVTLAGLTDATAPAAGDRLFVGEPAALKLGRDVYVTQCAHCHGTTGAGDGPTAKYLHPKPRNYRPGLYKFTSTGGATPSRADLTKILREGIPGTYMPAFSPYALDETQLAAVVEYVRWLSMRGSADQAIVNEAFLIPTEEAVAERIEGGETREEILSELTSDWAMNVTGAAGFGLAAIADQWANAELDPPVTPEEPYPAAELAAPDAKRASVFRGRELFLQNRTQCVSCHGAKGLGDGPQTVAVMNDEVTGEPFAAPGLHDKWGEPIRPRNLTRGIYRGGRRPIDLYRRLHDGIGPSKMPGFGQVLSDSEIWDLVNFVLALPHDPALLDGVTPEPPPTLGDAPRTAAL